MSLNRQAGQRSSSEKRQHLRYELIDFALLQSPDWEQPIQCVIVDLSLGGLQIRSKKPLPISVLCVLQVARKNGEPLEMHGEIRHSTKMPDTDMYASGFRFLPDSHGERMAIAEYVHEVFLRQSESLVS